MSSADWAMFVIGFAGGMVSASGAILLGVAWLERKSR